MSRSTGGQAGERGGRGRRGVSEAELSADRKHRSSAASSASHRCMQLSGPRPHLEQCAAWVRKPKMGSDHLKVIFVGSASAGRGPNIEVRY